MDTNTGKLYETKEEALTQGVLDEDLMQINATIRQMRNMKVRRNDPCPCNSGKKFKKCCLKNS